MRPSYVLAFFVTLAPLIAPPAAIARPPVAVDTAADERAPPPKPERWSVLVTFGDEPCPPSTAEEIIVCSPMPESERYRVPKELRASKDDRVYGQSWGARVEAADDDARITRPNSCSPVGSFGFSGCAAAALRQWFAERRGGWYESSSKSFGISGYHACKGDGFGATLAP